MNKLTAAFAGAMILATVVSSVATPAFALGACGRNGHRNAFGRCIFGGQNQSYCLRRTGHVAAYTGYGTRRCL